MSNMWKVPKMWEGGTVWILGGGPSLTKEFGIPDSVVEQVRKNELPLSTYSPYLEGIHNAHVIGVNVAFLFGDWVDMIFFGDRKFFLKYRNSIAAFKGLKVTCADYFKDNKGSSEGIRYLAKESTNRGKGISSNPQMVRWNANSGAAAISVAANAGASTIILVGFDMKLDDEENQHWHNAYRLKGTSGKKNPKLKTPFGRHLKGFEPIARDAKKRGIKIINASPNSAINVFEKKPVKELLNG